MSEGVRLYAGTQHGLIVWRSAANGWQEVARHFADGIIDSIHDCKQSPENVFVGVTHDGLYRTQDTGKSWTKVLDGDIRSVTVDPTASSEMARSTIKPLPSHTRHLNATSVTRRPSETDTATLTGIGVADVTVPLMIPVAESMVRPGGRLAAA